MSNWKRKFFKVLNTELIIWQVNTGVQLSLTDADMKQYLNSVLKEIKVIHEVDQIVKKGKEILETSIEFWLVYDSVVCGWPIIITLMFMKR